jgi:hypothetical protein
MNLATQVAKQHIKTSIGTLNYYKGDSWYVAGKYLFTKENELLNRSLGLHKLNKQN